MHHDDGRPALAGSEAVGQMNDAGKLQAIRCECHAFLHTISFGLIRRGLIPCC
jgi:hypothetical protein